MDFASAFYIHKSPSDLTGTPTITAGLGLRATGAGDNVSLASTAFSSWFNAAAGTVFVEFTQSSTGGGGLGRVVEISDGASAEIFQFFTPGAGSLVWGVTDGGVSQVSIGLAAPAFGTICRVAMRYAANDFQACINGTLGTADVAGTLPAVTQINLGNRPDGARFMDGYIRRFAYFPAVSTNAQLQLLTTAG